MSHEKAMIGKVLATLIVAMLSAGCGSGAKPGPAGTSAPKGPDAAPTTQPAEGDAAITAEFYTTMGDNAMNVTIHLAVLDANDNTVYTADAITGQFGVATFQGLPVGEFTLRFSDDRRNHCEFKVNLRDFTGEHSGASVGSCTF